MRLYPDICCLKPPFDSQHQALIRLEAEAVATILSLPPERGTADVLITVDERFRKKAERLDPPLRVRVTSPLVVAQEILEWKT